MKWKKFSLPVSSASVFFFPTGKSPDSEGHPAKLFPRMLLLAAKSLQSCPTLCDPIDGSPPVPGILQARTLERVAISFSNAWKWKVEVKSRSRVRLLATPWTAAYQAPPSMGFSRQEYWIGVPLPSPRPPLRDPNQCPHGWMIANIPMIDAWNTGCNSLFWL